MKKKIAVISDIHANLEGLKALLADIKKRDVDDIICLGDTVSLGVNSRECLDKLIDENIKMVLGNHELYLLKESAIDSSIEEGEKEHYRWVKNSLTAKEIDFISKCPLYYQYQWQNKQIIFSHYLINDENANQPFETNHLKKDASLFVKYYDENKLYIIGHLHNNFAINEVEGISESFKEILGEKTNIEIVESGGCTKSDEVSYMIVELDQDITIERIKVSFEKEKFCEKIMSADFPDKENILKYFYGIK